MSNTARAGWKDHERDMLLEEIRKAECEGRPVKSVFDRVSKLTGRKPNSIRNYYYMKLKEEDFIAERINTFVPFSDSELEELMRRILSGQAQGRSVRSIVMELAGGDKKAMLRYQNKYRSTIKNKPEFVKQIIQDMEEENVPCFDPYTTKRSGDVLIGEISELMQNLSKAGVSAEMLISEINALARMAAAAKTGGSTEELLRERAEREKLESQLAALRSGYAKIVERYEAQSQETARTISKLNELKMLNKSFLELEGMLKISGLSEYVAAVEECIK